MTFRVPDGVHAREVDRDLVILDSAGDRYFSLNESGVVVWRRLSAGGTVEEAVADLVTGYDIPRGRPAPTWMPSSPASPDRGCWSPRTD